MNIVLSIKRLLVCYQQMSLMNSFDEVPYDCGDNCITVFTSNFRGQLKPSHKITKALWMNFTQEEKDIWLSLSIDTQKRILSVHQHTQPCHQNRRRSFNPRPINQQSHFNQQRTVRLTDYYEMAGEPDDDINQDTSVRLADQYNVAGESDEVIIDNNATDENVPTTNT